MAILRGFLGSKERFVGVLGLPPQKETPIIRAKPYEATLLHLAATNGHLAIVDLLLKRGLDVNVREKGDNTYAMYWAAAGGHLEVVRRLADAGGDVVGRGVTTTPWRSSVGRRAGTPATTPSRNFLSVAARGTTSSPRSR